MALVHELELSGNWLFRRRLWLPVFIMVPGILAMFLANRQAIIFDMREELIFLGVTLFGQLIRILTVGWTTGNTSGSGTSSGQASDVINTSGMYSLVRHPLCLGDFFVLLGPVLFLNSLWFLIVFCMFYWLYSERVIFAEEQFLRRKFGDSYDEWSANVAPFLPMSFNFRKAEGPFSVRKVLKSEYRSFVYIFLLFMLLDLCRNYFLSGHIFITGMWMWIAVGGLLFSLAVMLINKKTSLLDSEGR